MAASPGWGNAMVSIQVLLTGLHALLLKSPVTASQLAFPSSSCASAGRLPPPPPEYGAALQDGSAIFLDHHQGPTFSYCDYPCHQLPRMSCCREGWSDQPVRHAQALPLSTLGSASGLEN